jgi:hypothetical protein
LGKEKLDMAKWRTWLGALAVLALALPGANTSATTLLDTNLVDLLRESESIVVGTVSDLTDGIDDRGLPYTEVTLEVTETISGNVSGTYVFRQFGLMEPRLSADGTKKMMPAPDVFPRYSAGEQVMLFLNKKAKVTGLQTTIGLAHGKFDLGATRAENGMGNIGVFHNVSLAEGLASENDTRMLATEAGAVNSDTFVSFVRRAVQDQWISRKMMWRTDEGLGGGNKPVKPVLPAPGNPDTIQSAPAGGSGSQTFGAK